jgi:hypothetical protein
LGHTNPHGDGFIFYSDKYGKPVDQHEPHKALKKMLIRIRIGITGLNIRQEIPKKKRRKRKSL